MCPHGQKTLPSVDLDDGRWAFSSEDFGNGEASKFYYTAMVAPYDDIPPKSEVVFNGYFLLKKETADGPKKVKITERELSVTFEEDSDDEGGESSSDTVHLSGHGENKFGKFTLSGVLHKSSKKVSCTKAYDDAEDEEDEGSEGEDAVDVDEVAEELADLEEDARQYGLLIEEKKPRKRKPVDDESTKGKRKKVGRAAADQPKPCNVVSSPLEKGTSQQKAAVASTAPLASSPPSTSASASASASAAAASDANVSASASKFNEGATWPMWALEDLKAAHSRLTECLAANDHASVSDALENLSSEKRISVDLLQQTGVGKSVRLLRKNPNGDVASKAQALVTRWRREVEVVKKT